MDILEGRRRDEKTKLKNGQDGLSWFAERSL